MVFQSKGVDTFVSALDASELSGAALGFRWRPSKTGEASLKIKEVADAYAVVNLGSGLASLPIGLVMSAPALSSFGSVSTTSLEVGTDTVSVTVLDGSGLASLPIGMTAPKVAFIDGVGLASLPIGLSPMTFMGMGDLTTRAVYLDGGSPGHLATSGSPLKARLDRGGFAAKGFGGASLVDALGDAGTVTLDASTCGVGDELD
jgi:hypothetical protein